MCALAANKALVSDSPWHEFTAAQTELPWEWKLAPQHELEGPKLARALGISPLLARLLINRGIDTPDKGRAYLDPSLNSLPSPFSLGQMNEAVIRLTQALQRHEPVLIYGDYDLDGIAASSILLSFLRHYGFKTELFIPHREKDGYGLQRTVLERFQAEGIRLVITCDNGTSALEEIRWAAASGIDLIVTDHHTLPDVLPPAVAVLNPMKPDTPEELRSLSGTGVAFLLVMALRKAWIECRAPVDPPNLRRMLDLVTLGTIADVVPLTGMNRTLVRYGLEELRLRRRPGLRALMDAAGVRAEEDVGTIAVGFRISPRLNAAGRLEDARLAVDLLLTQDLHEARRLAQHLESLNRQRQELEENILRDIEERLANLPDRLTRHSYVFGGDWHPGVVGIVAARLAELTRRPGIVLALNAGEGRGSGRAMAGFDLVEALNGCSDLLIRYGGHRLAVGLSLHADLLESFTDRFEAAASQQLGARAPARILTIDAELPARSVTSELVLELERLKPFGPGNAEPIFKLEGLQVQEYKTVGRGHLRMKMLHGTTGFTAIGFRLSQRARTEGEPRTIDVVACPEFNTFRGVRSLQLRLCDFRRAKP